MLTDAGSEWRDGVSSVAEVTPKSRSSAMGTVGLAVLVFAAGAFAGFIARLLWPRSR